MASGPRLTRPLSPSAESPPTVPTESAETEAVKTEATVPPPATRAETPEPAAMPESNPFDDAKTSNVKSDIAKTRTESKSAPVGGTNAADTSSSEEPPLVLPEESDDSIEVDPAPVPMPPAE